MNQPRTAKMNSVFTLIARLKGNTEENETGTSEVKLRNSGWVVPYRMDGKNTGCFHRCKKHPFKGSILIHDRAVHDIWCKLHNVLFSATKLSALPWANNRKIDIYFINAKQANGSHCLLQYYG